MRAGNVWAFALTVCLTLQAAEACAEPVYLRCKNLGLPPSDPNYIIMTVDLATGVASVAWHFTASGPLPAGVNRVPFKIQTANSQRITAISADAGNQFPNTSFSFSVDHLSGQVILNRSDASGSSDSSLACQPTHPVL
jgi:hypothetical protein